MIKNIALVSILSSLAVATNALAVETKLEDQKNYYFQLNTGTSFGTLPRGEFTSSTKHSTTPLLGAELGYKFDENFRAGFDLSYRPNYTLKDTTIENVPTSEEGWISNRTTYSSYQVKSLTAMANVYYDIPTTSDLTPYFTLGAGIARNTVKETENSTTASSYNDDGISLSSSSPVASKLSTSKSSFAYKMGLGVKYAINQDFDLDLRYQYVNLGKIRAKKTSVSSVENGKLHAQEVVLGVAYKF